MDNKCHVCSGHGAGPNPSVVQTLTEMEFERGIWTAAIDGNIPRIEKLLNKGVHVDEVDTSGYTALHYASRHGHVDVCQFLLSRKASVDARTRSGGVTSLQRASYCGNINVVNLLLINKANVLVSDNDGKTALHRAAEQGHVKVVQKLLSVKPQLKDMLDKHGRTAKDYVADNNIHLKELLT